MAVDLKLYNKKKNSRGYNTFPLNSRHLSVQAFRHSLTSTSVSINARHLSLYDSCLHHPLML